MIISQIFIIVHGLISVPSKKLRNNGNRTEIIQKLELIWVDENDTIHEYVWNEETYFLLDKENPPKERNDNNDESLTSFTTTTNFISNNDPTAFWLAWNERKKECFDENGDGGHKAGCNCFEGIGSVM